MANATVSTDSAPGAPPVTTEPSNKNASQQNAENKVIARCMRAWNYAYNKRFAESKDNFRSQKAAALAYLKAAPPLIGYKNICDFINCINFASMTDIVRSTEVERYLATAKIALTAALHEPKPFMNGPRPVGRPPKSASKEENK